MLMTNIFDRHEKVCKEFPSEVVKKLRANISMKLREFGRSVMILRNYKRNYPKALK